MIALIGLWSHLLAACLFGALSLWQLRRWTEDRVGRKLVAAFAAMAVWCIFIAFLGRGHLLSGLAESARNFAFLAFMYGFVRSAAADRRQQALTLVYFTLGAVVGLQIVLAGVLPRFAGDAAAYAALASTASLIGLIIAAGSLVMVHNLYGQAAPDSRGALRLPALALAGMWIYDLHLYTIAYTGREGAEDLFAMRGAILAMTVPIFALAMRRTRDWRLQISRAATFQSVSLIAILAYLIVMLSASQAMTLAGGEWVRIGQVGLVFAMTLAALVLLPSRKARAWLRVTVTKHLFEHRYDYRAEWLRFTRTIGQAGADASPIGERVVQALGDIAGAPSGLLLLADDDRRLHPAAGWNWQHATGSDTPEDAAFVDRLAATSHVVDFAALRDNCLSVDGDDIAVPAWMLEGGAVWAGIPLLHRDRLVGIVLLAHPLVRRPLDWEDFDLFRTAGMQAASYLAEAQGQEALADAQRFDEFNRRFAFIMHDIKNLVSQLSLVAHNAERHADNPEFRADMIATLQSSVAKMNALLARLGSGQSGDAQEVRAVALHPLLARVAETKKRLHPVIVTGDAVIAARADPARLEQAIVHLVQNAVEACDPGEPVRLHVALRGSEVAVEIVDRGTGMSADFVRTRLFQPFASSKATGFGIGAFEARSLVGAMGGRLAVESREGEGTRFTILLPAAALDAAADNLLEPRRMRA